ncbi:MAG: phosphatidylserine decarboxylase family protein [Flavobacteriales bacterium]
MIHREGYRIIYLAFAILAGSNLLFDVLFFHSTTSRILYLSLTCLLFLLIISFFRRPERTTREEVNAVVAPADGKIVAIEEVLEDEVLQCKMIQISVFMSPANVHINWFPVEGTVEYCRQHPGKYLVAWHPKSSTLNEHASTLINTGKHRVLVRQIAGFVARRIVCYAKEGNKVNRGDELGFIKFGSRVDVLLPQRAKTLVSIGEKVRGCETLLAEFE